MTDFIPIQILFRQGSITTSVLSFNKTMFLRTSEQFNFAHWLLLTLNVPPILAYEADPLFEISAKKPPTSTEIYALLLSHLFADLLTLIL